MGLCRNSGALGKQVVVLEGRRKPQVGQLACGRLPAAPASPLQWRGRGLMSLLSKAPRFLQDHPPHLVCASSARGCSCIPQTRAHAAGARRSVLRSCRAVPSVLPVLCLARSAPLPLCEGEGGQTDTSCGPASAPHPTHQKGEVAERRKSAPCSCFGCSSHIFSAAGSPSP